MEAGRSDMKNRGGRRIGVVEGVWKVREQKDGQRAEGSDMMII